MRRRPLRGGMVRRGQLTGVSKMLAETHIIQGSPQTGQASSKGKNDD